MKGGAFRFSVNIRINGQNVSILIGRNIGFVNKAEGLCRYAYEYQQLTQNKVKKTKGQVLHFRKHGIAGLVSIILSDVAHSDSED